MRNLTVVLDDNILDNAKAVLDEMGLDLQTYIRMALIRLIRENRIPFNLSATQVTPAQQTRQYAPAPIVYPTDTESHEMALSQREPRQKNTITQKMCLSIWDEFKRRYFSGDRNMKEASRVISNQTGMNRGSAFIYFNILYNLADGMQNKRNLKFEDLKFFMDRFKTELPMSTLEAAISSLEVSIPYWEENVPGSFADKVRMLVSRLKRYLEELKNDM